MPTPQRQPLEVLVAWLDAMRRQDLHELSDCYAPDVVWRGVVPHAVCHNRREVLDLLADQLAKGLPQVHALEMIAGEHAVVLGVCSPDLTEVAGVPLPGRIFNVFTIADGHITAVQDHTNRTAALRHAGASDPASS
jgi:ketosteroid isomerase-like protein